MKYDSMDKTEVRKLAKKFAKNFEDGDLKVEEEDEEEDDDKNSNTKDSKKAALNLKDVKSQEDVNKQLEEMKKKAMKKMNKGRNRTGVEPFAGAQSELEESFLLDLHKMLCPQKMVTVALNAKTGELLGNQTVDKVMIPEGKRSEGKGTEKKAGGQENEASESLLEKENVKAEVEDTDNGDTDNGDDEEKETTNKETTNTSTKEIQNSSLIPYTDTRAETNKKFQKLQPPGHPLFDLSNILMNSDHYLTPLKWGQEYPALKMYSFPFIVNVIEFPEAPSLPSFRKVRNILFQHEFINIF
jgi:hypothetical protein